MWAHYTDRHRGYCVRFNRNHPFFAEETLQKSNLRPVMYGLSRIDFAKKLNGQGPGMPFYKSTDWAYEQESRVVFYWKREGLIDFIDGKKAFPPGVPVRLVAVPHEAICELIVGMEADLELKGKLIELGAKLRVPVYDAYPSPTKLAIDRELVS